MKYMIDCTARTNLVMVPDLRDEIRTTVPSDLIRSGLAAESLIDGNDINCFMDFFDHRSTISINFFEDPKICLKTFYFQ